MNDNLEGVHVSRIHLINAVFIAVSPMVSTCASECAINVNPGFGGRYSVSLGNICIVFTLLIDLNPAMRRWEQGLCCPNTIVPVLAFICHFRHISCNSLAAFPTN